MAKWKEEFIIYEDADLMVCRKPAGIAVQSARIGQKDMVSLLNNYRAEKREEARKKSGREPGKSGSMKMAEPVHVVHRLDQPVEGVLVFAKTKAGAAGLSRQITDGSMEKIYHAVCCVTKQGENYLPADRVLSDKQSADRGSETKQQFCLADYLVRDGRTNTSRVAAKGQKDAKEARLHFCILDTKRDPVSGNTYALVRVHLETGRHHQIRVQLSHAGLPLYGDRKYNAQCAEFFMENQKDLDGAAEPALCAAELAFVHPTRKKDMRFRVKPQHPAFSMFEAVDTVDNVPENGSTGG